MEQHLVLPGPKNVRETLSLFLFYEEEIGLDSVLNRTDLSGKNARDIYLCALGRLPESVSVAATGRSFAPRAFMRAALQGNEFQAGIMTALLNAFPEKRREIFVHVPKCAGTDLVESMKRRCPTLYEELSFTSFLDKPQFFAELKRLVGGILLSEKIGVTGHIPLQWYIKSGFIRGQDTVTTTIREPAEIVLSFANFVVTRLKQFRDVERGDTREWLTNIGLTELPPNADDGFFKELVQKILRNPAIVGANIICRFLGQGTAETALNNLIVTDAEITDTLRYTDWRKAKWGVEMKRRHNASEIILNASELSDADRGYIESITREDQKIFLFLKTKLDEAGTLSIRGTSLA